MTIRRFRSTRVVEAIHWDGSETVALEIVNWLTGRFRVGAAFGYHVDTREPYIVIQSSDFPQDKVEPGEVVTCTTGGEMEILSLEEFGDRYEYLPVED